MTRLTRDGLDCPRLGRARIVPEYGVNVFYRMFLTLQALFGPNAGFGRSYTLGQ
jgi:hypothetical protein